MAYLQPGTAQEATKCHIWAVVLSVRFVQRDKSALYLKPACPSHPVFQGTRLMLLSVGQSQAVLHGAPADNLNWTSFSEPLSTAHGDLGLQRRTEGRTWFPSPAFAEPHDISWIKCLHTFSKVCGKLLTLSNAFCVQFAGNRAHSEKDSSWSRIR